MYRLLLLLITLLSFTSAAADDARLTRINLQVANLERSLSFYRDILGLTVSQEGSAGFGDYVPTLFGFRPGDYRFALLDSADQPRVLGLIENRGQQTSSQPYPSAVVFRVSDVEAVAGKARSMGLEVAPLNEGGGGNVSVLEVALSDPDGHRLLIYSVQTAPAPE